MLPFSRGTDMLRIAVGALLLPPESADGRGSCDCLASKRFRARVGGRGTFDLARPCFELCKEAVLHFLCQDMAPLWRLAQQPCVGCCQKSL